jgi:hypothetical protein
MPSPQAARGKTSHRRHEWHTNPTDMSKEFLVSDQGVCDDTRVGKLSFSGCKITPFREWIEGYLCITRFLA